MNLPNSITLVRLLLVIPFLWTLELGGYERWALGLFVFASLTDWVDGYLARKLNQITALGALLDPLVDKVLVSGALVALTARGVLPAWSVTAILFREFLVTGLRALEASHGIILSAGMLGKAKTVCQMIAIAILLAVLDPIGHGLLPGPLATAGLWVYWLSVALTIVSGAQYLWLGRGLFKPPPAGPSHST